MLDLREMVRNAPESLAAPRRVDLPAQAVGYVAMTWGEVGGSRWAYISPSNQLVTVFARAHNLNHVRERMWRDGLVFMGEVEGLGHPVRVAVHSDRPPT